MNEGGDLPGLDLMDQVDPDEDDDDDVRLFEDEFGMP